MIPVWKLVVAFTTGVGIAARSYRRKSLSLDGAFLASITGFTHVLVGIRPTASLLSFFFSSSWLTKYKSEKKKTLEFNYKEGGQRDWKQVFANSGLEVGVCCLYLYWFGDESYPIDFNLHYWPSFLLTLILGGYATSNGDTWASELGIISDGAVWLITTGQRVPSGTNGGISVQGTLASLGGGLLVGTMFYFCSLITSNNTISTLTTQWPSILLGVFAGFTGTFIDSLLGATLEYSGFDEDQKKVVNMKTEKSKYISGRDILNGNQVNFISIIITSLLTSFVAPHFFALAQ